MVNVHFSIFESIMGRLWILVCSIRLPDITLADYIFIYIYIRYFKMYFI